MDDLMVYFSVLLRDSGGLIAIAIIIGLLIAAVICVAGFFGLMYFINIWLPHRVKKSTYDRVNLRDSKGQKIEQTGFAKTQLAGLPFDVAYLAKIGNDAAPRQTLNTTHLRPTIGLRVISLGLSAVFMAMFFAPASSSASLPPSTMLMMLTIVGYAALHTNLYSASYDNHSLIAPNRFFQRKEYRWNDITAIKDNGHYLYQLHLINGQKVEIQKYLVGIRDFLTFAQEKIAQNNRS